MSPHPSFHFLLPPRGIRPHLTTPPSPSTGQPDPEDFSSLDIYVTTQTQWRMWYEEQQPTAGLRRSRLFQLQQRCPGQRKVSVGLWLEQHLGKGQAAQHARDMGDLLSAAASNPQSAFKCYLPWNRRCHSPFRRRNTGSAVSLFCQASSLQGQMGFA